MVLSKSLSFTVTLAYSVAAKKGYARMLMLSDSLVAPVWMVHRGEKLEWSAFDRRIHVEMMRPGKLRAEEITSYDLVVLDSLESINALISPEPIVVYGVLHIVSNGELIHYHSPLAVRARAKVLIINKVPPFDLDYARARAERTVNVGEYDTAFVVPMCKKLYSTSHPPLYVVPQVHVLIELLMEGKNGETFKGTVNVSSCSKLVNVRELLNLEEKLLF